MTARVRKRVLAGSRRTWADSRLIVPADGTSAAAVGNGDFGTSPFFGQLSGKPRLACTHASGVSKRKEQWRLGN
jgi:hypothetical protein